MQFQMKIKKIKKSRVSTKPKIIIIIIKNNEYLNVNNQVLQTNKGIILKKCKQFTLQFTIPNTIAHKNCNTIM